jgi:Lon protease-like protein
VPDEIGLFPLELVLLPTERIPLHIFEERYKELIGECITEEREFGLLLEGAEIGTRAAVTQVLQELPDGRLNVVVEGRERFRVVERTEGRSFDTAQVEPVEDDDEPPEPEEVERAVEIFGRLVELTETDVDAPSPDSPLLAFELAARVDFGNALKQELLEIRSPQERVVRLTELLERAAEAIALEKDVQDRASRNGKVTPLKSDDLG